MKIVTGESITAEVVEMIVDQFEYEDEHYRKAAIDKVNNNIFAETDIDDLDSIAKSLSIDK